MANTRDTMGEQACLDALVADTLTSFEDDGVISVRNLRSKKSLVRVTLPKCKSIDSNGLSNCNNLEVVDMLGTGNIGSNSFLGDNRLSHIILRGASKTTLNPSMTFYETPIENLSGAIYVPSELVDTYKEDSSWSNYLIVPIDRYPLTTFESISDDWDTIIAKAQAGTASQSYKVGDSKLLDLGSEGVINMQIVGFGLDELADGSGNASITFVGKQLLKTMRRYNPVRSSDPEDGTKYKEGTGTIGGWEKSEIRSYLTDTILPLVPSNVATAIKAVKKYSDGFSASTSKVANMETTDTLWIPSAREVFGAVSGYETSGPVYTDLFDSAESRKKTVVGSTSLTYWWLRSASTSTYPRYVDSGGYVNSYNTASSQYGVALGFCL